MQLYVPEALADIFKQNLGTDRLKKKVLNFYCGTEASSITILQEGSPYLVPYFSARKISK